MKSIVKSKYFCFFVASLLFVGFQLLVIQKSFASESFQNNLLKTDIRKNSLGAVKVTLYTSKPYNDAVVVNKKGENQYVILLPETANSQTSRPTVHSDVVKNVTVKTQQYSHGIKGYTKMVINTSKPVEVTSHVQTLSSNFALRDKDYSELLAQTSKKHRARNKTIQSDNKVQQQRAAKSIRSNASNSNVATLSTKELRAKRRDVKTSQRNSDRVAVAPQVERKSRKVQSRRDVVSRTSLKETNNAAKSQRVSQRTEKPVKVARHRESVETRQETNVSKPVKSVQTVASQPATPQPVESAQPAQTVNKVESPEVVPNVTPEPSKVVTSQPKTHAVGKVQKIKNLVKKNIYVIAGALFVLFLLMLIAIRNANKKLQKQKENFVNNLGQSKGFATGDGSAQGEQRKFTTADWQENVQAQPPSPSELEENIDDLFGSDYEGENVTSEVTPEPVLGQDEETSTSMDDMLALQGRYSEAESEASIDDILGSEADDVEIPPYSPQQNLYIQPVYVKNKPQQVKSASVSAEELVKSEFVIDEAKGFYLVDFENVTALVGHIRDEIFVLKRFDSKINAPLQARLDERKRYSSNYMTRVGKFKGIVEVTPESMNLLIEL